jgi:hypothetical protein
VPRAKLSRARHHPLNLGNHNPARPNFRIARLAVATELNLSPRFLQQRGASFETPAAQAPQNDILS